MGTGPTPLSSVQRAFRLLEAVSAHENGAPAKQPAREAGLPRPAGDPVGVLCSPGVPARFGRPARPAGIRTP